MDANDWRSLPLLAIELFEKSAKTAVAARRAMLSLPMAGFVSLHHNSQRDSLWLCQSGMAKSALSAWTEALAPLGSEWLVAPAPPVDPWDSPLPWVKLAYRAPVARFLREKAGASRTLNWLGRNLGYMEGGALPVGPSPLVAGLTSGMLGAGLGYGSGWLAEQVLPEDWKRKRLRRTLAALGGAAGLALPAVWAATNLHNGKSWNDGSAGRNVVPGGVSLRGMPEELSLIRSRPGWDQYGKLPDLGKASSATGYDGEWPPIDVPRFNQTVWDDPNVASRLQPSEQAAVTGLTSGASRLRGGSRWITPMDVARLSAGMGAGYLSGALAGKVLGTLTGMPQSTQNRLKQTGLWAGVVSSVVPLIFG